jgi:hypothetical protein
MKIDWTKIGNVLLSNFILLVIGSCFALAFLYGMMITPIR